MMMRIGGWSLSTRKLREKKEPGFKEEIPNTHYISSIRQDSPAAKSGKFWPGMRVLKVNDKDTSGLYTDVTD